MSSEITFQVTSAKPPTIELSDAGLYIRFQLDVAVASTQIQQVWPHIAVDLDSSGNVIGIEVVPAPPKFSIGSIPLIAQQARVDKLPDYDPADVQIANLAAA